MTTTASLADFIARNFTDDALPIDSFPSIDAMIDAMIDDTRDDLNDDDLAIARDDHDALRNAIRAILASLDLI